MEAGISVPRAPQLIGIPFALFLALVGFAIAIAALGAGSNCGGAVGELSSSVPAELAPIYQQAAARYELGPQGPSMLAGINKVETDFGKNTSTSSAGAQGWMQFLPSTWATYGVDGDGDGRRDIGDPWDAIFGAAKYLRASGAPGDWHGAIFAYNHAESYVREVVSYADQFASGGRDQHRRDWMRVGSEWPRCFADSDQGLSTPPLRDAAASLHGTRLQPRARGRADSFGC